MDNDHSSRTTITRSLKRPTRELGRATLYALLFGLAPSGVCRASDVTTGAGELLPHRFTLTSENKRSRGGLLSVALSFPSLGLGVTQHLALWSSDFPLPRPPKNGRHEAAII